MSNENGGSSDFSVKVKELRDSIIEVVRSRAKNFLEKNEVAEKFLSERAERLAELSLRYVAASDSDRESIKADIEIVRQTIENEISSLVLKASKTSADLFKSILSATFDLLVKALPTIVSAL